MRDDRGQPYRRTWGEAQYQKATAHTREPKSQTLTHTALACGIGLFALAIVFMVMSYTVAIVVCTLLGCASIIVYLRQLPPIPNAGALIESGRCRACLYDLNEIPPDADACTVCPECGAAWRLPDTPDA